MAKFELKINISRCTCSFTSDRFIIQKKERFLWKRRLDFRCSSKPSFHLIGWVRRSSSLESFFFVSLHFSGDINWKKKIRNDLDLSSCNCFLNRWIEKDSLAGVRAERSIYSNQPRCREEVASRQVKTVFFSFHEININKKWSHHDMHAGSSLPIVCAGLRR